MKKPKKENFLTRLISGERGTFILCMLAGILLGLILWIIDLQNYGYSWETEGVYFLGWILLLVAIILGTAIHYFLTDYPRDKREAGNDAR